MRMLRPDIPQALEQFVTRMMERRPDHRPGGMQEVIAALRALAASETTPDEVAPSGLLALLREERRPRTEVWRWPGAGRVVAGATALAVAAVATWAVVDWPAWRSADTRAAAERLQARELENEQRREAARAANAELHRRMQAAAERRAEERRRAEVSARAALLRVESPPPARSAEELFRIRSEIQQKLFSRGLFRVSAADPWGVTLDIGSRAEVILSGVLPDMARYNEALRLVREVPGVGEVQAADLSVAGP